MKTILALSILFISFASNAQQVKITGTVTDSLGNTLALANIIATNKLDSSVVGFAIANQEGRYQIRLSEKTTYVLTASFMGMRPVKKELIIAENSQDLAVNFILKAKSNQLQGVELVYEIPVIVKGDTIVYNTDSFTNGNEQKLGDVLEKLPGFEVSDEGDVKAEGKKVTKVMVEGKGFFGGNTRLATKNIPANAVDKIEVLRDYNEVSQLDNVKHSQESVALNIKLKSDKKKFWFGSARGGVGSGGETRYLGSTRLFRYTPKTSVNLIGNTNNIGEVPFTFMDYFNFMGGLDQAFGNGTSINLGGDGLGAVLVQDERVKASENDFGALNINSSLSEQWEIGAFFIYSANKTRFVSKNSQQYVQTQIVEEAHERRELNNQLGMFKFKADFTPSARFQLNYDAMIKRSNFDQKGRSTNIFYVGIEKEINSVSEKRTDEPSSFRQNLNAYYTLNERNIFAVYFQHLNKEGNPMYHALVKNTPFSEIFPWTSTQKPFDLQQQKALKTQKIDGKIDYYYVLNDKSHLNFSLGATWSHQDFNSSIFQGLEAGEKDHLEENTFNNCVEYDFRDTYLGAHYKLLSGIFTFMTGATLHQYTTKNSQSGNITNREKIFLLPKFDAVAQFQESESLRFSYLMSANFPSVEKLSKAYVFSSYNRLFRGDPFLKDGLSHQLSLRYRFFNMFNFTTTNFHVKYSKKIKSVVNNFITEQVSQVSFPVNSEFPSESFALGGSFQKTFRKLRADVDADINFGSYASFVNQEKQQVNTLEQTYQLSLETNFDDFPNVEIGYQQHIDQYDNGDRVKTYYTGKLFLQTDIYFLQDFRFSADYNYFNYSDKAKTMTNRYAFLNAELVYESPSDHWEFSLEGINLLGVEAMYREGVTASLNYRTTYFVQPRIFLFSVNYKL